MMKHAEESARTADQDASGQMIAEQQNAEHDRKYRRQVVSGATLVTGYRCTS